MQNTPQNKAMLIEAINAKRISMTCAICTDTKAAAQGVNNSLGTKEAKSDAVLFVDGNRLMGIGGPRFNII